MRCYEEVSDGWFNMINRITHSIGKTQKNSITKTIVGMLKRRREIISAYLHGSFLESCFRDIDVAIYIDEENENVLYELNLERELEEIVGVPVDIRILNRAPLSFRFRVIEDGVLLFSKDEKRSCDFESLVMAEHHDFSFHSEIYRRVALGIEV